MQTASAALRIKPVGPSTLLLSTSRNIFPICFAFSRRHEVEMRHLHQFRTVYSAKTVWCLTSSQISGGCLMFFDCVALTAHLTTKSVL
jgi:hypothetical protein